MAVSTTKVANAVEVCTCAVGNPYYDLDGVCRCTAGADIQPPIYDSPVKSGGSNIHVVSTTKGANAITFSLVDWVKAHPFIVAGAAGLLIYFLFIMRRRGR